MDQVDSAAPADVQSLIARIERLEGELARHSHIEQELRQSEQRYRSLFEHAPIAIFVHEGERILYANQAMADLIAAPSLEAVAGMSIWKIVDSSYRDLVNERIAALMSGERVSAELIEEFHRFDGTLVPVAVLGVASVYGGKRVVQVVARDISEHKRVQEQLRQAHDRLERRVEERTAALRENQSRLDLALRAAEIGMWTWDLRTGEVQFSPHYKRHLGYEDSELVDHVDEWWGRLHPDDLPRVKESLAAFLNRPWPNYEIDFRLRHRDGDYLWMLDRADLQTDASGAPIKLTGCLIDITERKRAEEMLRQSEERFREVTETITEVFWLEDWIPKKVLYVSPAYERIWGRPVEDLYNNQRNWIEAIHPEDRAQTVEAFLTKAELGQYDVEYRINRPDGGQRWIRDRGFPIQDETGKVVRMAGIAQDITLLKEAQEKVELSQRLASIGTFASGIAHEINNPLSAIMLSAYASQRRLGDKAFLAESLGEILAHAQRCARIVKSVHRFSQKREIEKLPTNLVSLINVAVNLTLDYAKSRGVELHLSLQESQRSVDLNPTEIEQVLVNLIRNAVEACKRGDQVWVESAHAQDHVLLKVRDNGCGMSADARRFAFDPFYTTKQNQGGTGLGLSLARGIITDHGGTIEIASEEGGGTTVSIKLPCE